jgi:hypothetical protein
MRINAPAPLPACLSLLKGGDRRSIGAANQVVDAVLAHPALFAEVMRGLLGADPLIAARCADVAEKVSAVHPQYLQPYAPRLLALAQAPYAEVRWHIAQMLPRLVLDTPARHNALRILFDYLRDDSRIVRTFALQALTEFAQRDTKLRARVVALLAEASKHGSAAMQARSRKLLSELDMRTRASAQA